MEIKGSRARNWTELIELRKLLFDEELKEPQKPPTEEMPPLTPEEVSELLPDAIVHSAKTDKKLGKALAPIVEESLDESIRRNPQNIVDAIFPVIGPAIRKSIAETLRGMIQSINAALEHSFSAQGMKWRIEAMRTGKPFAEVALSHSLVYRVEQVFLIHGASGLLLHHIALDAVDAADGDMISGMLTAIQDFVYDSFDRGKSGSLETMQVGELSVWIEQGPRAVLAGVIRGDAPPELRALFAETLETIHLECREELQDFSGDTEPFARTRPILEQCLKVQKEKGGSRFSRLLWIIPLALLIGAGIWALIPIIEQGSRWGQFIEQLNSEPGIVVLSVDKQGGKHVVSGLRDPLAFNPETIHSGTEIDSANVIYRWRPIQSLAPKFVLSRAATLLDPPETVALTFADGVLIAQGEASQAWVVEAHKLVKAVAGVTRFDDARLFSTEVLALRNRVQRQVFFFDLGRSRLGADQRRILQNLVVFMKRLILDAREIRKEVHYEIVGQADKIGSDRLNLKISTERAQRVRSALISMGLRSDYVSAVGVGSRDTTFAEVSSRNTIKRRVFFRATLSPMLGQEGMSR